MPKKSKKTEPVVEGPLNEPVGDDGLGTGNEPTVPKSAMEILLDDLAVLVGSGQFSAAREVLKEVQSKSSADDPGPLVECLVCILSTQKTDKETLDLLTELFKCAVVAETKSLNKDNSPEQVAERKELIRCMEEAHGEYDAYDTYGDMYHAQQAIGGPSSGESFGKFLKSPCRAEHEVLTSVLQMDSLRKRRGPTRVIPGELFCYLREQTESRDNAVSTKYLCLTALMWKQLSVLEKLVSTKSEHLRECQVAHELLLEMRSAVSSGKTDTPSKKILSDCFSKLLRALDGETFDTIAGFLAKSSMNEAIPCFVELASERVERNKLKLLGKELSSVAGYLAILKNFEAEPVDAGKCATTLVGYEPSSLVRILTGADPSVGKTHPDKALGSLAHIMQLCPVKLGLPLMGKILEAYIEHSEENPSCSNKQALAAARCMLKNVKDAANQFAYAEKPATWLGEQPPEFSSSLSPLPSYENALVAAAQRDRLLKPIADMYDSLLPRARKEMPQTPAEAPSDSKKKEISADALPTEDWLAKLLASDDMTSQESLRTVLDETEKAIDDPKTLCLCMYRVSLAYAKHHEKKRDGTMLDKLRGHLVNAEAKEMIARQMAENLRQYIEGESTTITPLELPAGMGDAALDGRCKIIVEAYRQVILATSLSNLVKFVMGNQLATADESATSKPTTDTPLSDFTKSVEDDEPDAWDEPAMSKSVVETLLDELIGFVKKDQLDFANALLREIRNNISRDDCELFARCSREICALVGQKTDKKDEILALLTGIFECAVVAEEKELRASDPDYYCCEYFDGPVGDDTQHGDFHEHPDDHLAHQHEGGTLQDGHGAKQDGNDAEEENYYDDAVQEAFKRMLKEVYLPGKISDEPFGHLVKHVLACLALESEEQSTYIQYLFRKASKNSQFLAVRWLIANKSEHLLQEQKYPSSVLYVLEKAMSAASISANPMSAAPGRAEVGPLKEAGFDCFKMLLSKLNDEMFDKVAEALVKRSQNEAPDYFVAFLNEFTERHKKLELLDRTQIPGAWCLAILKGVEKGRMTPANGARALVECKALSLAPLLSGVVPGVRMEEAKQTLERVARIAQNCPTELGLSLTKEALEAYMEYSENEHALAAARCMLRNVEDAMDCLASTAGASARVGKQPPEFSPNLSPLQFWHKELVAAARLDSRLKTIYADIYNPMISRAGEELPQTPAEAPSDTKRRKIIADALPSRSWLTKELFASDDDMASQKRLSELLGEIKMMDIDQLKIIGCPCMHELLAAYEEHHKKKQEGGMRGRVQGFFANSASKLTVATQAKKAFGLHIEGRSTTITLKRLPEDITCRALDGRLAYIFETAQQIANKVNAAAAAAEAAEKEPQPASAMRLAS